MRVIETFFGYGYFTKSGMFVPVERSEPQEEKIKGLWRKGVFYGMKEPGAWAALNHICGRN